MSVGSSPATNRACTPSGTAARPANGQPSKPPATHTATDVCECVTLSWGEATACQPTWQRTLGIRLRLSAAPAVNATMVNVLGSRVVLLVNMPLLPSRSAHERSPSLCPPALATARHNAASASAQATPRTQRNAWNVRRLPLSAPSTSEAGAANKACSRRYRYERSANCGLRDGLRACALLHRQAAPIFPRLQAEAVQQVVQRLPVVVNLVTIVDRVQCRTCKPQGEQRRDAGDAGPAASRGSPGGLRHLRRRRIAAGPSAASHLGGAKGGQT